MRQRGQEHVLGPVGGLGLAPRLLLARQQLLPLLLHLQPADRLGPQGLVGRGQLGGALPHPLFQLGVHALQRLLGPAALGDLALQLLGRAHGQRPWHDRHQADHGRPGDRGRQHLDDPGKTVKRLVKGDYFHQVRQAAPQDEGPEHPEHPGKGHVAAAADQADQHQRDGHVGQPDQAVGGVVEPDQPLGPPASAAARHELRSVPQAAQIVHHVFIPVPDVAGKRVGAAGGGRPR
jgi:hypothetical protein